MLTYSRATTRVAPTEIDQTTTMKGSKRYEAEPCEDHYRYHCYCCRV